MQRVYDDIEQFHTKTMDERLDRIRSISVQLDDSKDLVSVTFGFSFDGLSLVVAGRADTAVEGTRSALGRALDEAERWPRLNGWWVSGTAGAIAAAMPVMALTVGALVGWNPLPDWLVLDQPVLFLVGGLAATGLVGAAVAMPIRYLAEPFELLAPGALTRAERLEEWLKRRRNWLIGAVGLAVIGAVVRMLLS